LVDAKRAKRVSIADFIDKLSQKKVETDRENENDSGNDKSSDFKSEEDPL
jgi:hypothetical protein